MAKQKMITDKEMLEIIANAVENFEGNLSVCESAIGALIVGRALGWQALRVLHSSSTLNKYDEILGISLKERLPARTEAATRLRGIRIADTFEKFWKALGAGALATPDAKLITSAGEA